MGRAPVATPPGLKASFTDGWPARQVSCAISGPILAPQYSVVSSTEATRALPMGQEMASALWGPSMRMGA
jgi:hypothetical protein